MLISEPMCDLGRCFLGSAPTDALRYTSAFADLLGELTA